MYLRQEEKRRNYPKWNKYSKVNSKIYQIPKSVLYVVLRFALSIQQNAIVIGTKCHTIPKLSNINHYDISIYSVRDDTYDIKYCLLGEGLWSTLI